MMHPIKFRVTGSKDNGWGSSLLQLSVELSQIYLLCSCSKIPNPSTHSFNCVIQFTLCSDFDNTPSTWLTPTEPQPISLGRE